MSKKFEIKRFSCLSDSYDEGITANEIENMLNKIENDRVGYTENSTKWEVKEIINKI